MAAINTFLAALGKGKGKGNVKDTVKKVEVKAAAKAVTRTQVDTHPQVCSPLLAGITTQQHICQDGDTTVHPQSTPQAASRHADSHTH